MSDPFELVAAGEAETLREALAREPELLRQRHAGGASLLAWAAYMGKPEMVAVVRFHRRMPFPCAIGWPGRASANRQIAVSVRGMATSEASSRARLSEANRVSGSSANVAQPSTTQSRASTSLASLTSVSVLIDRGFSIGTA